MGTFQNVFPCTYNRYLIQKWAYRSGLASSHHIYRDLIIYCNRIADPFDQIDILDILLLFLDFFWKFLYFRSRGSLDIFIGIQLKKKKGFLLGILLVVCVVFFAELLLHTFQCTKSSVVVFFFVLVFQLNIILIKGSSII